VNENLLLCPGLQLISGSILLLFDGTEKEDTPSTAKVVVIDFNHSFYASHELKKDEVDKNYIHGITSLILLLEAVLRMPFSAPPRRVINSANEEQVKNKEAWDKVVSSLILSSGLIQTPLP
jgi:hypothetical protein